MKPITVLQLVASSHGGGAAHVRDLALGLPRDRYQVTVAMPVDGGNVSPADFAGLEFVPVKIGSGFALRQVWRLRRMMREGGFQLLHVHGARAAFYGRLAASTIHPRPRIVFSIHGFATPYYPPIRRLICLGLERALQRITDRTICAARAGAGLFLSFRLASPERLHVLPCGIKVSRFAEPPANSHNLREELNLGPGPVVLTVCRLNVPRDFDTLLRAFRRVRDEFSQARLMIVGDGPQRAEVEAQVRRMRLARYVRLTGFRRDVPALLALADVYVLTSYGWEGYPISTLEAQAAGVPVVVTDAGGAGEAVLHGETGLVVPKRRPELLAEALLDLLRDSDARRRLGKAGQKRAFHEFTRQRMVESMMSIYDGLQIR